MNSHRNFGSFAFISSLALLTSCGDNTSTGPVDTLTVGNTSTTTGGLQTSGVAPASTGVPTTTTNPTTTPTTTTAGPTGPTTTAATSTGPSGASGATSAPTTSQTTTTSGATSTTTAQTSTGQSGTSTTAEETSTAPADDENGKPFAAALGTRTDQPQDYIRLGEMRILNNNWGSEDLGCFAPTSTMSVFVNQDGSFGWDFNRGDCASAMDTSHPDFPQLEFGIHPFGIGSDLATSPEFSSTTLLPLQIKDIQSASMTLDNFNIQLGGADSWNIAMEFWLSEGDPTIPGTDPKVYAELMAWWGWDQGRWPCGDGGSMTNNHTDTVQAGNMSYRLCHQNDQWADGKWRYYQFRAGDATDGNIKTNFSGTIDIKAFLDYLVNSRNYSTELWVTRIEVGSEIDDLTNGTVSMKGAKFEINGEERSQVIAP